MARDFTCNIYEELLKSAIDGGYQCMAYQDYVKNVHAGKAKKFILRHDVDKKPQNSVEIAKIQYKQGVRGTYFWRIVPESYDERCIREVVDMGHELGYHYEDLTLAKGDVKKAYEMYQRNLETFRKFYQVDTICMHGSPMTKWDNKDIWKSYDYKQNGIIAEPYFDTDFRKVFYITDTGRSWNNETSSVRDKVDSGYNIPVSSTEHFIQLFRQGKLPAEIMMNIHPQRWTDNSVEWTTELIMQNLKNVIKRIIVNRQ